MHLSTLPVILLLTSSSLTLSAPIEKATYALANPISQAEGQTPESEDHSALDVRKTKCSDSPTETEAECDAYIKSLEPDYEYALHHHTRTLEAPVDTTATTLTNAKPQAEGQTPGLEDPSSLTKRDHSNHHMTPEGEVAMKEVNKEMERIGKEPQNVRSLEARKKQTPEEEAAMKEWLKWNKRNDPQQNPALEARKQKETPEDKAEEAYFLKWYKREDPQQNPALEARKQKETPEDKAEEAYFLKWYKREDPQQTRSLEARKNQTPEEKAAMKEWLKWNKRDEPQQTRALEARKLKTLADETPTPPVTPKNKECPEMPNVDEEDCQQWIKQKNEEGLQSEKLDKELGE